MVFLELLNHLSVLFSSLSILRTIILNYLWGSSWFLLLGGPVIGDLLYSFSGVLLPLFFTIPVSLCVYPFEEAVISSRLYGLTSVREDFHMWALAHWSVL